jgi:hypothetical protein
MCFKANKAGFSEKACFAEKANQKGDKMWWLNEISEKDEDKKRKKCEKIRRNYQIVCIFSVFRGLFR